MIPSIRSLVGAAALAVVLAACGTSASSDPQSSPDPSALPTSSPAPSTPDESPAASPEAIGTLTVAEGMVADGPGITIAEAMAADLSQAVLVRGVVFRDADGQIFIADSVVDASTPTFGDARLRVANYPTGSPTWDMADAEITGLQEVNGVLFFDDTKLYGSIDS